jgi:hypothetical protein
LGQAGQTEIEQNVLEETQKNKGKNVMFYLTSFFQLKSIKDVMLYSAIALHSTTSTGLSNNP